MFSIRQPLLGVPRAKAVVKPGFSPGREIEVRPQVFLRSCASNGDKLDFVIENGVMDVTTGIRAIFDLRAGRADLWR